MNGIPWSPDEQNRITELVGDIPSPLVPETYNTWAATNGLPIRTPRAIWRRAELLGCRRIQIGDWLTPYDAAKILQIPSDRVYRWVAAFPSILKPYRPFNSPRGKVFIQRAAFLRFARRHPAWFGGIAADDLFMLIEHRSLADRIASTHTKRSGGNPKAVRCLTNGRMFPSVADAARSVAVCRSAMSQALRHGWQCGGFMWEVVA